MMKETKLILKNDEPLMFSPKMAEKLGLNEAIMLQQIHYWLEMNKANNSNYYDGFYWTFNSYVNWQKNQFSFWSVKTIQRILTKLEKDNLLISGNYNKKKYDKTKWYRINYELIYELFNEPIGQNDQRDIKATGQNDQRVSEPIGQNVQMDEDKLSKGIGQNDQTHWTDCPDPLDKMTKPFGQNDQMDEDKMTKPIPETNIDYKENNKENNKKNNKENNKENNNKNINNKLINNSNNSKEEINYVFDTKEKNINNYSLVIQKDYIIDYYFEKYNDTYNKTHDKIDNEKIYSKIDNFSLSYNINSGTWIELIDYHFSLSDLKTNGSIDDFLNDNIIKKYLDSINNDSLVSKEENNNNIPLVVDKYYEDEIEYSGVDSNIKDILQYFVNKYFDYYGCKYSEKETFYTDDIKKYAKLIYSFSSDFGIEATIDGWKKKVDVFFTLEYDKTLDTFLQFDVINHILNSIYYEEYEEYENNDLPF